MRNQRFGIEIEMTGITRTKAAKVIAGHFNSEAIYVGGVYDSYTVRDNESRLWKVVSDASIKCETRNGSTSSRAYSVELVSDM